MYNKQYYELHKEEIKAKRRERYKNNPDYQKNYNKEHSQEQCERVKKYYSTHKEIYNKYQVEYQKKHPELKKNKYQTYKFKLDNNFTCSNCGYVGDSKSIHAHHIIPLSQGGTDTIDNLICLCEECHLKIHNKNKY